MATAISAQPAEIAGFKTGYDVIFDTYKAYSGNKWYRYFTFSQETIFYKAGQIEKTETWHEAISSPGKLLIKFNSKDSKDGALFENGKVHVFKKGEGPVTKTKLHDLCLAAFDIYFLKPEVTCRLLDSLGYNLNLAREDVFDNRKVFVVGAKKGDSLSNQIWIDVERFYLHRIIYKQGKTINDACLTDYSKIENNWVAKKIIFKQNGVLEVEEKYFDIRFPKELSPDLFNPEKFNTVRLD